MAMMYDMSRQYHAERIMPAAERRRAAVMQATLTAVYGQTGISG